MIHYSLWLKPLNCLPGPVICPGSYPECVSELNRRMAVMITRNSRLTGVALCTALFVLPVQADRTIVLKDKVKGDSSTFQVKGSYVRISSTDEPGYTLYDKSRNIMIHVDDRKRAYYEIDLKILQQQMQGASQQMAQMRAQLAAMPPEQRRIMEQQMPGISGSSAPVTNKAKGSRKVNGYSCKAYEFYQQGRLIGEVCLASASATGIGKSDYSTLMSMMGFMQAMAKMTSDMIGETTGHDPLMLSNLKGIPIMTKDPADGSDMTINSLSGSKLDSKLFTAYKSYTRQPIEMMDSDAPY